MPLNTEITLHYQKQYDDINTVVFALFVKLLNSSSHHRKLISE